MTEIISILSVLILGLIIGWKIGSKRTLSILKHKTSFYDSFVNEPGTGRYGIIRVNSSYKNYGTIEVREIASAYKKTHSGDEKWVKIQMLKIYQDEGEEKKTIKQILNQYGYSEWCPEREIIWFTDNDSRIRDERLKNLLNK